MIQQSLHDFIKYLKNPTPFTKTAKVSVFYNQLFPLVIIALGFSLSASLISHLLEELKMISKMPEFDLFDSKEKNWVLFLKVVLLAPILEELIFRFQLKNYAMSVLFYSFLSIAIVYNFYTGIFLKLSIVFILLICTTFLAFLKPKFSRYSIIKKIFPYHFYLTAIIFGLVHISNYSHPFNYGFAVILLILPQLFAGFVLGYVRMRFGLWQSMLMHASYNFIPALVFLAGY